MGQKWGIRRFQNEDRSLTPEGKERYRKNSEKTSGSSDQKKKQNSDELFKQLKAKHIVAGTNEGFDQKTKQSSVELAKDSDLYVRDAITGLGTILKEDLDNHTYLTSVKVGFGSNVDAYALIKRDGNKIDVTAYGEEGLIKQGLADQAVKKIEERITNFNEAHSKSDASSDADKKTTSILQDKDGNGLIVKHDKFDDKKDKKIHSEFASDSELKAVKNDLIKSLKAMGYDVTKMTGLDSNGAYNKSNSFNKKSDAEQMYMMFCLAEALGMIELPKGYWD